MRCRFCHARVAGRPLQCPKCGFQTGARRSVEWDARTGERTRVGWFRVGFIAACIISVIAGITLRETGTIVTMHGLRHKAYGHTASGIKAFLAGDYAVAIDHLELAIHAEPTFPEAHLALSLALLGRGRSADAIQHAYLAADLARLGLLDKRSGLDLGDGSNADFDRLSKQVHCVAAELQGTLSVLESRRLMSVFGDLTRLSTCNAGLHSLLNQPGRASHRILQRALIGCPADFPCPEQ